MVSKQDTENKTRGFKQQQKLLTVKESATYRMEHVRGWLDTRDLNPKQQTGENCWKNNMVKVNELLCFHKAAEQHCAH